MPEECKFECRCSDCLENSYVYPDGCCTGCEICETALDMPVTGNCPFGWYHSVEELKEK